MAKTHYFLAVPIPNHIKKLYLEWRESNKDIFPFKSWVHHEDYHITLAFLGDASSPRIEEIIEEMERVKDMHVPFHLQLSGLGYFGKKESPRIFWSGIEKQPLLERLQQDVFLACQSIGFELEKRPFRPHLTLARRWKEEAGFPNGQLASLFQVDKDSLSFTVESFVLYQTHLDRSPKYETLKVFYLEG
jgi:2'-5' RNA ligase